MLTLHLIASLHCPWGHFYDAVANLFNWSWSWYNMPSLMCSGLNTNSMCSVARTFVENTTASWRWCYYVLIMLSGASLLLQLFCYFPPTFKQLHQGRTKMQMIKTLDYGGFVLFSGSLACILLGISWGGQKYGTFP